MDTQNDGLKKLDSVKIWPIFGIYVRFLGCPHFVCIFFGKRSMKSTQISPTKPAETRQVQSYFFRVMALSVDQHPCMKVLSVIDGKVDIFTV